MGRRRRVYSSPSSRGADRAHAAAAARRGESEARARGRAADRSPTGSSFAWTTCLHHGARGHGGTRSSSRRSIGSIATRAVGPGTTVRVRVCVVLLARALRKINQIHFRESVSPCADGRAYRRRRWDLGDRMQARFDSSISKNCAEPEKNFHCVTPPLCTRAHGRPQDAQCRLSADSYPIERKRHTHTWRVAPEAPSGSARAAHLSLNALTQWRVTTAPPILASAARVQGHRFRCTIPAHRAPHELRQPMFAPPAHDGRGMRAACIAGRVRGGARAHALDSLTLTHARALCARHMPRLRSCSSALQVPTCLAHALPHDSPQYHHHTREGAPRSGASSEQPTTRMHKRSPRDGGPVAAAARRNTETDVIKMSHHALP